MASGYNGNHPVLESDEVNLKKKSSAPLAGEVVCGFVP